MGTEMRNLSFVSLALSVCLGFACSHEESVSMEDLAAPSAGPVSESIASGISLGAKRLPPCASGKEIEEDELAEINSDTKATKTNPLPKADCVINPEYLENR
jgi:hypothetical protein